MTATRTAFRVSVGMIAVSAVIGIGGLITNGMSSTGISAMASALTITVASLFCLACFSVWDSQYTQTVSRAGVVATVGATLLALYLMWADPHDDHEASKLLGMSTIIAIGCVHACLLSRAKLAPTRTWLRSVALASSCVCGSLMIGALCFESDDKELFVAIGILLVIVGALTVIIALATLAARVAASTGVPGDVCFCPGCGRSMWEPSGQIRCQGCGESFVVTKVVVADLPTATLS
ncbi:MAG: hypothetical protein QM831_39200 [Kofleriaceae bacterium]